MTSEIKTEPALVDCLDGVLASVEVPGLVRFEASEHRLASGTPDSATSYVSNPEGPYCLEPSITRDISGSFNMLSFFQPTIFHIRLEDIDGAVGSDSWKTTLQKKVEDTVQRTIPAKEISSHDTYVFAYNVTQGNSSSTTFEYVLTFAQLIERLRLRL